MYSGQSVKTAFMEAIGPSTREQFLQDLGMEDQEIFLQLLDEDIDSSSRNRGTMLHFAAGKGNIEIVSWLIEMGAALNITSRIIGETPLHSAGRWGHREVFEKLVMAGADIDAINKHGKTPIYNLIRRTKEEIAHFIEIGKRSELGELIRQGEILVRLLDSGLEAYNEKNTTSLTPR